MTAAPKKRKRPFRRFVVVQGAPLPEAAMQSELDPHTIAVVRAAYERRRRADAAELRSRSRSPSFEALELPEPPREFPEAEDSTEDLEPLSAPVA